MMHLFIDTNVLVGFYEMSSDSLVELEKVITVIRKKEAILWLPDQVKREFWKNREACVIKAIRDFDKADVLPAAPVLVREEARFRDLLDRSKELERLKSEIVEAVRTQVIAEKTRADTAVRALFSVATEIDCGPYFHAAHERALRHLPPGKEEGVGDRLNWLAMLAEVPEGSELHVISDDGDFESEATKGAMKQYLTCEWGTKKKGSVHLWKRISQFLASHFPDAENAIDMERTIAVQRFIEAGSFSATHSAVEELTKFHGFSSDQAKAISSAVIENSQIRWIASDEDVKAFLETFLKMNSKMLEPTNVEQIRKAMET